MVRTLKDEFQYYIDHQDELVKMYQGKVIVIKDAEVIGVYDSDIEAITETSKTHELGTFLVQRCEPGPNAYTQTFHSRVCLSIAMHYYHAFSEYSAPELCCLSRRHRQCLAHKSQE